MEKRPIYQVKSRGWSADDREILRRLTGRTFLWLVISRNPKGLFCKIYADSKRQKLIRATLVPWPAIAGHQKKSPAQNIAAEEEAYLDRLEEEIHEP